LEAKAISPCLTRSSDGVANAVAQLKEKKTVAKNILCKILNPSKNANGPNETHNEARPDIITHPADPTQHDKAAA
jgi:hypothetical protein